MRPSARHLLTRLLVVASVACAPCPLYNTHEGTLRMFRDMQKRRQSGAAWRLTWRGRAPRVSLGLRRVLMLDPRPMATGTFRPPCSPPWALNLQHARAVECQGTESPQDKTLSAPPSTLASLRMARFRSPCLALQWCCANASLSIHGPRGRRGVGVVRLNPGSPCVCCTVGNALYTRLWTNFKDCRPKVNKTCQNTQNRLGAHPRRP